MTYQSRLFLAGPDAKETCPDGFMSKWRYVWGLSLSRPFVQNNLDEDPGSCFDWVDNQLEKIFDVYAEGPVFESRKNSGSEQEFLARLGFAIQTRQPEVIAFTEQIREWALTRFRAFDNEYFNPEYGTSVSNIFGWQKALLAQIESKINTSFKNLFEVQEQFDELLAQHEKGQITPQQFRDRAISSGIGHKFINNINVFQEALTFTREELLASLPNNTSPTLLDDLTLIPGKYPGEFKYPHQENPLEFCIFVQLPDHKLFFIDPNHSVRVTAKAFERDLLQTPKIKSRYLRNRSRVTEERVANWLGILFEGSQYYRNYYLGRGQSEKDILLIYKGALLIIECKNLKIRPFKGKSTDTLHVKDDFNKTIQHAYNQALEVKRLILSNNETHFTDVKGKPYFSIKNAEISEIFIICVTFTQLRMFGTNLALLLNKEENEPYPLAINMYDLETICKNFDADQFLGYLRARQSLHGRVKADDELEYAGYYYKEGNLEFEQKGEYVILQEGFSSVFDRNWSREKGIEVEEPTNKPVFSVLRRRGNKLIFEIEGDKNSRETLRIGPEFLHQTGKTPLDIKGRDRNKPCPCGSGFKAKQCCAK